MSIAPDVMVERQVFFNSKLKVIVAFDPEDKRYVHFLGHLSGSPEGRDISWDNVEDFVPSVEIVITRDLTGYFSYKVTLDSADTINPSDWRKIRDSVNQVLADFESAKFGTKNRLFYSEKKEEVELEGKSKEIVRRKHLVFELRREYEELVDKIRDLVKRKASTSEMAKHLKTTEDTVTEYLYAPHTRRPTPAYLAKAILMEGPLVRKLKIDDIDKLDDQILHRGRCSEFPKHRRYVPRKRLVDLPSEEEIEEFSDLT